MSRELKIFAVAWTVIFIGLIGGVVYLIHNNNKYVSMYDVTVTTRSDRSGQGGSPNNEIENSVNNSAIETMREYGKRRYW